MAVKFDLIRVGAAGGGRRDSFVETFQQETGRVAVNLSWRDVVAEPEQLRALLHDQAYVCFDSPDRDLDSLAALYGLGLADAEDAGMETLTNRQVPTLAEGDIGAPAQLAFGMIRAVVRVTAEVEASGAKASVTATDLGRAFDKTACLKDLVAAGIAVPEVLTEIDGFDALAAAMSAKGLARVFVKVRYGSAAAGIVALARQDDAWRARTTAVLTDHGRIRVTSDVQQLTKRQDIERLVNRLAPLGLHVEAWLPKIGIDGLVTDVRIVVVGGEQMYPVLRRGRHPMTNLHIGGQRGPIDALITRIGDAAWRDACDSARQAAARFSGSDSVGIDLAVLADGRRHAVLEVNVFGSYIRDLTVNGVTPHQAQVRHIARRMARAAA